MLEDGRVIHTRNVTYDITDRESWKEERKEREGSAGVQQRRRAAIFRNPVFIGWLHQAGSCGRTGQYRHKVRDFFFAIYGHITDTYAGVSGT